VSEDRAASAPDALVGRSREFGRLRELLDAANPTLVVLVGEDSMGKTTMLAAIEADAWDRGWSTARCQSERVLSVGGHTTPTDFFHDIEAVLRSPFERQRRSTMSGIMPAATGLHPSAARLVAFAPVIVLIDGYRPSAEFAEWFVGHFVAGIMQSHAPVIIVVADRQAVLEELASKADERIVLGALARSEVEEWFETLGAALAPPMTDKERATYVDAVIDDPSRFSKLTRVLDLTRSPTS